MTSAVLRWWPLVGLAGLVAVGVAVGNGSTTLDDSFRHAGAAHPALGRLLVFTDGRVIAVAWALAVVALAVRRRWRLALVAVVTPPVAVVAARTGKRLFGRLSDGTLAYPSGHTTLAVVVLGLIVLSVGVTAWTLVAAGVVTALGMLGQACTYHYFTDTVGALFLATALLAVAARAAGLDARRNAVRSTSHQIVNMGG